MPDPASLIRLLTGLGVRRGGVLMVHSSLSGTGLSALQVRDALLSVLGPDGTLITPAFTPENSDTSREHLAAVRGLTRWEIREFRAAMPPFEPDATPCLSMGALAECVRTTPGAVRSSHPHTSMAGLGRRAAELLARHHPHCHLGEDSPLAALYEADARILLLRVGFGVCSAFHLAEYRLTPPPPPRVYRCVTGRKGNWTSYEDIALDDRDFADVGAALPRGLLAEGEWAGKAVVVIGMRAAVDNACAVMSRMRAQAA
ncbi:AAC(3) family N-acetyltransferase [Streptomyces sp. NPDC001709]